VRICLVSQEYPPGYVGGIGTQTRVKAQGLLARGHDVEVLTAGHESGPELCTREQAGVAVHALAPPGGGFAVNHTETYWLGYTWAVLRALRTLTAERCYDLIDFPDYGAEGLAFQLDRAPEDETAVVVHLHGPLSMFSEQIGWPEPGDPLLRLGTFMEDMSIETADGLLAASRSVAELTARRNAIDPELIGIVAGAVDSDVFAPAGDSDGDGRDDAVRVLFVGNVADNKGVGVVLDAFARVAPEHPLLRLTIAGGADQEVAAELRGRAAKAGLGERVELCGFVEHDRLPALYRSADVFAAPSRYEGGLGLVYLEAMACGLPVVAAATGGTAEAVAPGETGFLLERGDAEETAQAIRTLVGDPALRARMGAAARRRVLEHFAAAPYAQKVESVYERAVERRRAAMASRA
jgi:glycosyltransferase involved in cell wall biosynthesis